LHSFYVAALGPFFIRIRTLAPPSCVYAVGGSIFHCRRGTLDSAPFLLKIISLCFQVLSLPLAVPSSSVARWSLLVNLITTITSCVAFELRSLARARAIKRAGSVFTKGSTAKSYTLAIVAGVNVCRPTGRVRSLQDPTCIAFIPILTRGLASLRIRAFRVRRTHADISARET